MVQIEGLVGWWCAERCKNPLSMEMRKIFLIEIVAKLYCFILLHAWIEMSKF